MDFELVLNYLIGEIEKKLKGSNVVPKGYLENHIDLVSFFKAEIKNEGDEIRLRFIRHLETYFGTTHDVGSCLSINHEEWYTNKRKSEVDSFYWGRLEKYWLEEKILPKEVVKTIDKVTDKILGYSGDPQNINTWQRRGLVMGHVQSGKTTNYSALITKAADAGYRIIIVLAGLTNSLRSQTQERLDQTFVGKSSISDGINSKVYPVWRHGSSKNRSPYCGTTIHADVNKVKSVGTLAAEGTFAEPILYVTKKNPNVLNALLEALTKLQPGNKLDGPLLLIDDEADNGSVDTSNDPARATKINELIGLLLGCCRRSTYIGYTATPFANIFIDPDTTKGMEDLPIFPRDFIYALDAPDNYIGAHKLFPEENTEDSITCIKPLVEGDYLDILPLKHKSDLLVVELPKSLVDAVRLYVLFRARRILEGEGKKHSSMLVNVSRFNKVQEQVLELIDDVLKEIKEAAGVWAKSDEYKKSPEINNLESVWNKEYMHTSKHTWKEVRGVLLEAITSIDAKLVNMKGGPLNYEANKNEGLHVIAIGGLALARGLTLEGLSISYVLRNVGASDTLLQIGRWFGYRPGYDKYCRVYLTDEMNQHFIHVNTAVEELRDDLKKMIALKKTPYDFGLKVRFSETGIAITAKNKMRTATAIEMALDLSEKHKQGYMIYNNNEINTKHLEAIKDLVGKMQASGYENDKEENAAIVWKNVDVKHIDALLKNMDLPVKEFIDMGQNNTLLLDYINDRSNTELARWDVAIPVRKNGKQQLPEYLRDIVNDGYCRERHSARFEHGFIKITQKNTIIDVAKKDLVYGEEDKEGLMNNVRSIIEEFKKKNLGKQPPSEVGLILSFRKRPLLLIHLLDLELDTKESEKHGKAINIQGPIATISIGFNSTGTETRPRVYAVTSRLLELMAQDVVDDETDEEIYEEN